MKLAGSLVLVASFSSCGKADEPEALGEHESADVADRPVLNILPDGTMITIRRARYDPEKDDMTEVERYLADQARRMPKKKDGTLGGIELPDNPLMIQADKASKRVWVNGALRAERDPIAEQFAAEYSKIASEQSAQPSSLTIPAELRSPDYVFGLETRNNVLWLHAHAHPRLYTVTSRGGEILAKGIALDELERRFPEFAGFERLGETDLIED
ncbi:MAG: hypothetical protein ABL998_23630 [Planctomycetota bacterium]